MRKAWIAALAALSFATAASATPDAKVATVVPLDRTLEVGGVMVGCTGIGQTKTDPRWLEFPIRVEFSNPAREYLVGAVVAVSDARGRLVLTVSCEGPWVLLNLHKGASYKVEAILLERPASAPRSATVKATNTQQRIVLQFPDA